MIFLFLDRCVCPRISRKFLFRRNAKTGFSENVGAISGLVFSRCQCFSIIGLILGRCLLKVVVKGIFLPASTFFSWRSSSRFISPAFRFCSFRFAIGYPLFLNLASMSSNEISASLLLVQIFLARRNCPNGIFSFCLTGRLVGVVVEICVSISWLSVKFCIQSSISL